jgi:hypothetical protein
MPDSSNGIRVKVMSSSCGSVMLRFNNTVMLNWTALRTYFVECDFKYHKMLWLSSRTPIGF